MRVPVYVFGLIATVNFGACSLDASVGGGVVPDADPSVPDAESIPNTPDANPDAPDAGCDWSFSPQFFSPCASPAAGPGLTLDKTTGDYVYNTDNGHLTSPAPVSQVAFPPSSSEAGVRMLWLTRFEIEPGVRLRVIGLKALMIAADDEIVIDGTIDASSSLRGFFYDLGGGSNPSCLAGQPGLGVACSNHGSSGGGGAGFRGSGGSGGAGGIGHDCQVAGFNNGRPGGVGAAGSADIPTALRGGCAGATGASAEGGLPTAGGPGGGAVMLSARNRIKIAGVVHVGGAGGQGCYGGKRTSGGGGGSGGMIGLESARIELMGTGALAANGGGGGGGCDHQTGTHGADATANADFAGGGPGENANKGGAGGRGGYLDDVSGAVGTSHERGGGGGGGGAGFVVIYTDQVTTGGDFTVSPAPL